jgi:hypothetical protein
MLKQSERREMGSSRLPEWGRGLRSEGMGEGESSQTESIP